MEITLLRVGRIKYGHVETSHVSRINLPVCERIKRGHTVGFGTTKSLVKRERKRAEEQFTSLVVLLYSRLLALSSSVRVCLVSY